MNLEPSEVKPRKIIKMMQLSLAKMTYSELKMPQQLNLETKFSKKKNLLKNREKQLLPRLKHEKKRCKCWMHPEPIR